MNNGMYNVYNGNQVPPEQPATATPKRTFTVTETVFAWVTLFLGYLYCRAVPVHENPLGALIFTALLFIAGGIYLIRAGAKQTVASLTFLLSPALFALSFFICDNEIIHTCSFIWIIISYMYWIYLSCGNSVAPLGDLTLLDFLKALFIIPWCSLGSFAGAAFSGHGKTGSKGKNVMMGVLWVFLGLCIAAIPTFIVIMLLSYDESFQTLMKKIFDLPVDKIASHIGSLILAVPIAFYGFALLISSSDRCMKDKMTAEGMTKFVRVIKFAPRLMVCFAVIPLLAVYILFFVSQGGYYLSAFTGVLPEGIDIYSAYAREGFFELCWVSGLNAAIIVLISLFTKGNAKGKPSAVQRILTGLVSLSSLILIATAVSKMALYINAYGLTPLRVYTTWFMLLLAAAFLLVIVRQLVPKFNLTAVLLAVFIVFFGVLALADTDRIIVRYNADRFIDGTLESFDVAAMSALGDDAVPELLRVAEWLTDKQGIDPCGLTVSFALSGVDAHTYMSQTEIYGSEYKATNKSNEYAGVYKDITEALRTWDRERGSSDGGFFGLTLPRLRADNAAAPYRSTAEG